MEIYFPVTFLSNSSLLKSQRLQIPKLTITATFNFLNQSEAQLKKIFIDSIKTEYSFIDPSFFYL